jgi:hypothetical protein
VWASTGAPRNILYCLGKPPPARRPRPAATITTEAMGVFGWEDVSWDIAMGGGVLPAIGGHNETLHLPKNYAKWSKA